MRAATAVEIGERDAEQHADRRQIRRHPLKLALLDAVDSGLADTAGLAGERLLRPALQLARLLDDAADVLRCHNLCLPKAGYLGLTLFQIEDYQNRGYRIPMAPQADLIKQ